jgi:hypothetical protein
MNFDNFKVGVFESWIQFPLVPRDHHVCNSVGERIVFSINGAASEHSHAKKLTKDRP